MTMTDSFSLGGKTLTSRLFIGTGKYANDALLPEIAAKSGAQVITVALRRMDFAAKTDNILQHIPQHIQLLPNTSGARNAQEAALLPPLNPGAYTPIVRGAGATTGNALVEVYEVQ